MTKKITGLYAIVDPAFCKDRDPIFVAEEILKGGGKILQLRVKQGFSDTERKEWALQLKALKEKYDYCLIINDDINLAMAINADGVHVGQDDAPVAEVKKRVGKKIVGYSSHDVEEAIAAEQAGADYVALGAIFPTPTKGVGHPICGLEQLKIVVNTVHIPVVAIGGIKRENLKSVLATGVSCVAMITELSHAENIADRACVITHACQNIY